MSLHESTFEYLKPTDDQMYKMQVMRSATKNYAEFIERMVPDGADKTYMLRKVRELGMWANASITRHADGTPRSYIRFSGFGRCIGVKVISNQPASKQAFRLKEKL